MKICYLILAHNNFKHLNRLIEALDDTQSSFYIHLDKKTEELYSSERNNVKVIPTRLDINWGGFSMIEATLALMEYAVSQSNDADYYVLVSGVDFPIRSKDFLNKLLAQNKEYIDIAPLPVPHKPVERYQYYYFDYNRRTVKHYNPFFLVEVLLKKFKIKRTPPFEIYAGTQWFALTSKCVHYILDIINSDRRYVNFFRHTLVPDEAFFQTIIGNSPFYSKTASSLTYTDWQVPVPPAEIEDRHVDFLKDHIVFKDEYGERFPYFARKFNDNSGSVIARIKKELWK